MLWTLGQRGQTHVGREYGLPGVTGVPEAPSQIRRGDLFTVDGYLGIIAGITFFFEISANFLFLVREEFQHRR
jgi:hypothetical protein